jgi:uncharacterized metal-binding protein YceD (DUF177 family)
MRMRQHNSEKLRPWRVLVAVEDVAEAGQSFALAADAEAREAIARMAGLRELSRLEANFDVTPQGSGGLHVVGRVSATVGQNCVVTLEPLTNDVEEHVDLRFMPQSAEIEGEGEAGASGSPAESSSGHPEPLIGGVIDLGALATEFLVLGLDPYPRKPGAVFEPQREERPDESPFAALAGLKSRQ